MTDTPPRPRGRRPGREDTRAVIKAAALKLFSSVGYDKVSLRSIAREADVDPALIHHYFESKAELFARTVLDLPMDAEAIVERILAGPRNEIGANAIREFLDAWDSPGGARERFTAMLRSAVTDDTGRRPMSEYLSKEIFAPVAEALGHPNAKIRAQLAVSLILGLSLTRYILKLPGMAGAKHSQLVEYAGPAMQHYLVDSW